MLLTEEQVEQVHVTINARAAALAWVNAFLATSDDRERPALYRTLSVEVFRGGVQFIGCNGHAIFRSWVPVLADDVVPPWPLAEEKPEHSIVVRDPVGFGIGFMKSLLRVTNEDDHAFEDLTITTSPCDDIAELALGAEFQTARLTLRACGQRIDLQLYDGPFPAWRFLNLGLLPAERVDGMTVAGRLLSLIGKLKGCGAVNLEFHGDERHIGFVARGENEVRGDIMPMRREKTSRTDEDEEE